MKKNIIKIISFIFIFCILFNRFSHIYSFKENPGTTNMKSFYLQEEDSIDVIFVGSSVVFDGVNTGVLWEEYGIASYDLAGAAQTIWNSYFFIKEAFKTQSPKLIVLDVYALRVTEDYQNSGRTIGNNFGFNLSLDYLESIKASSEKEHWVDYLLRFPTYHIRYEDLSKEDFQPYSKEHKGFQFLAQTSVESCRPEGFETNEVGEITDKNEEYLRKICELCRDEKVPLLLIKTPYQTDRQETMLFNRAAEIAAEYDIPFVNFNYYYDDMGIDFPTHFYDTVHLNGEGSELFSSYLGQYIKNHFDISDHRNEERYETYDIMVKADYLSKSYNASVVNTCDLEAYLSMIQNPDYVVVYSLSENCWNISNYEEVRNLLQITGMDINGLFNYGGGAWVMQNQQIAYWATQEKWYTELSPYNSLSVSLKLNEKGENTWQSPDICFNRNIYNKTDNGLNIFIYDMVTESVVEAAYFEIVDDKLQYEKIV